MASLHAKHNPKALLFLLHFKHFSSQSTLISVVGIVVGIVVRVIIGVVVKVVVCISAGVVVEIVVGISAGIVVEIVVGIFRRETSCYCSWDCSYDFFWYSC